MRMVTERGGGASGKWDCSKVRGAAPPFAMSRLAPGAGVLPLRALRGAESCRIEGPALPHPPGLPGHHMPSLLAPGLITVLTHSCGLRMGVLEDNFI